MKKVTFLFILVATTILLAFKVKDVSVWEVDKNHSKIGFVVTHLLVSEVEGHFSKFDAKITTSNDDFSDAAVELSADIASINTDNEKRDIQLRSAEFFDVAKYPTLTFKSTSFKPVGNQKYIIKGNLTMHGITKPIILNGTIKQGINPMNKKPVAGFKVSGTIKRSDFNVGSYPPAIISNEVEINANGEFGKN